jgi:hypothetical protein
MKNNRQELLLPSERSSKCRKGIHQKRKSDVVVALS